MRSKDFKQILEDIVYVRYHFTQINVSLTKNYNKFTILQITVQYTGHDIKMEPSYSYTGQNVSGRGVFDCAMTDYSVRLQFDFRRG